LIKPTNKNSILVLATLGVYIGLVLVGATPQVLARAAMTREFCVKDEIEVKDDLDKKPDDQPTKTDNSYLDDFAAAYTGYYADGYRSGVNLDGQLRLGCPTCFVLHKFVYFPTFRPDLERVFGTNEYPTNIRWTHKFHISSTEISYFPSKGKFAYLHNAFANPSKRNQRLWTPSATLARENAELTLNAKNHHLVVITHLPRGSLPLSLAKGSM
jgi:hypothetical protein